MLGRLTDYQATFARFRNDLGIILNAERAATEAGGATNSTMTPFGASVIDGNEISEPSAFLT
jgi:hypothetical protein